MRAWQITVAVWWVACCVVGCGDGTAEPGYADPCGTAMGGVLGCPAGRPGLAAPTVTDACRRLAGCGVLAETFWLSSNKVCKADESCDANRGGRCQKAEDGWFRCHYPTLDLRWCALRMSTSANRPCASGQFSPAEVQQAIRCIVATPCATVGLPFSHKRLPSKVRPQLDRLTCDDNKTAVWTATICDHGLLAY